MSMKRYMFTLAWALIALTMFVGCGDDSNSIDGGRDGVSGEISNAVCKNWGASRSEVEKRMEDYELVAMDKEFLCYAGKDSVRTISYSFQDDRLQGALVSIPVKSVPHEEVMGWFSDYLYLGSKGSEVFVNQAENFFVFIGKQSWEGGKGWYWAIGFAPLEDVVLEETPDEQ